MRLVRVKVIRENREVFGEMVERGSRWGRESKASGTDLVVRKVMPAFPKDEEDETKLQNFLEIMGCFQLIKK